ncbi:restriction endonuclease subunit S [Hymenobacter sp. BRD128]|uniref:restriction endonuclease subunit S n=1 Tax=Hymenobacter sp. BRD128 TaxID=2675878 RepID=UPI00156365DC|nr:restriction endonuclease subunit S [Hymenobacter sp. BRD128]QKG55216.1 restriction endonuclease subunit S [Hymenobacter sp. BRD128]
MKWRSIRIGDFLHRVRIPVDIEDDQQYNLVTIRMHHKGVALRATKPGKEIGTKRMYAVQPGHFILSGIDARHGAFGIVPPELAGAVVTNDFWYFEVDEAQVDKELFLHLTSTTFFDDLCRLASDGTTNRVRLQADKFFNYEISLPPVEEQRELIAQLKHTNAAVASVLDETDQQLAHLTKLRQALLREAMQGQLLPQDPTDEPAAVLLQQLQAAAKPGKKGRGPAAPLFAEAAEAVEGPFEIPASWVWCELKKVVKSIFDGPFGSHLKTADYTTAGVRVIRLENLDYGKFKHDKTTYISLEKYEGLKQHTIYEGDIIVGSFIADGVKAVLIPELGETAIAKADCFCIRHNPTAVDNKFLTYLLGTDFISDGYLRIMRGMTRSRINTAQLKQTLIPLPPLAEQHRIVAKLAQLLQHCDALEQRIREGRRLAEQLLAIALREALAPPAGATPTIAAEPALAEDAPAPARRAAKRGSQLALGSLLD